MSRRGSRKACEGSPDAFSESFRDESGCERSGSDLPKQRRLIFRKTFGIVPLLFLQTVKNDWWFLQKPLVFTNS